MACINWQIMRWRCVDLASSLGLYVLRLTHRYLGQLLLNTVKERPDAYLEELKLQLEEEAGAEVSIATIWRALTKGGLTMKKVFDPTSFLLGPVAQTAEISFHQLLSNEVRPRDKTTEIGW
jgi:hypothetical protein